MLWLNKTPSGRGGQQKAAVKCPRGLRDFFYGAFDHQTFHYSKEKKNNRSLILLAVFSIYSKN